MRLLLIYFFPCEMRPGIWWQKKKLKKEKKNKQRTESLSALPINDSESKEKNWWNRVKLVMAVIESIIINIFFIKSFSNSSFHPLPSWAWIFLLKCKCPLYLSYSHSFLDFFSFSSSLLILRLSSSNQPNLFLSISLSRLSSLLYLQGFQEANKGNMFFLWYKSHSK